VTRVKGREHPAHGRREMDRGGDSDQLFGRRSYDHPAEGWDPLRMGAYGFLGGLVLGVIVWSQQVHQHRQGLFSRSPLRRLAALGYLRGQPSVDTARLLHDYIRWEPRPVLRRRGELLLRQVEHYLDE
jgi:hypothetical protein